MYRWSNIRGGVTKISQERGQVVLEFLIKGAEKRRRTKSLSSLCGILGRRIIEFFRAPPRFVTPTPSVFLPPYPSLYPLKSINKISSPTGDQNGIQEDRG